MTWMIAAGRISGLLAVALVGKPVKHGGVCRLFLPGNDEYRTKVSRQA